MKKIFSCSTIALVIFLASAIQAQTPFSSLEKELVTLLRTGKAKAAIQLLEERLKTERDQKVILKCHRFLGEIYARKLDIERAIHHYDLYLAGHPGDGAAYFRKGQILQMRSDKHDEALELFKKSLEKGFSSPDLFASMAFIYRVRATKETNREKKKEYFKLSVEGYTKALNMDPKHIPSWGNLGDIMFNIGAYKQASMAYRKITELMPNNIQASVKLAHCHIQMKDYETAMEILQKAETQMATRKVPDVVHLKFTFRQTRASIYAYMVEALLAQGKREEAKSVLKKLIKATEPDQGKWKFKQLDAWHEKAKKTLEALEK